MEEKKKDDSNTATVSGIVSVQSNNNTNISTYQSENFSRAEMECVNMVVEKASLNGNIQGHSLSTLADMVISATRTMVEMANRPVKAGGRGLNWPKPRNISPIQAAQLVFAYEHIRMVYPKETINKTTANGVLAKYVTDGDDFGVYREIGMGEIDEWSEMMAGSVNGRWKKDFKDKLHDMASRRENRVCECDNENLVFMKNAIYDYETGMYLPFAPDIVVLRKNDTVLPTVEPPEPIHMKPDGSCITFWEWLDSLAPYFGGRDLLIKLAGAVLRNHHNWRVMVTIFNTSGHNGKSTYLRMLKALIGPSGVMSSSLAALAGCGDGGRFGVSNIVGVSLITCEDSDSGAYIRDNARLKCIISHDPIKVERKGVDTFDYTPHAMIICAANDLAKTKDKGQAWLERNVYIPFTGRFIGCTDDKTISSKWVVSEEFCSYMAYQALVKWDKYYELPEPQKAIELKHQYVLENDSVAEFWEEELASTYLDFLPNPYVWNEYKEWMKEARPNTVLMTEKAFIKRFTELAIESGEWMQPKDVSDGNLKISVERWCYPEPWGLRTGGRQRGVVRTVMWEYCHAHGNLSPKDLGDIEYRKLRKQLGLNVEEIKDLL